MLHGHLPVRRLRLPRADAADRTCLESRSDEREARGCPRRGDHDWEQGPLVAHANFGAPIYGMACPDWAWDTEIAVPDPQEADDQARHLALRDWSCPATMQFGHPDTVTETGEAQRIRGQADCERQPTTYDYDMPSNQSWIASSRERICQGTGTSDCYTTSRTFGARSGARITETLAASRRDTPTTRTGTSRTVTNALSQTMTLSGYATGNGIPTRIDFNGAYSRTRTALLGRQPAERDQRAGPRHHEHLRRRGADRDHHAARRQCAVHVRPRPPATAMRRRAGTAPRCSVETTTLDGLGRVTATANNPRPAADARVRRARDVSSSSSYAFGTGSARGGRSLRATTASAGPPRRHRRFLVMGASVRSPATAPSRARCQGGRRLPGRTMRRSTVVDRAPNNRVDHAPVLRVVRRPDPGTAGVRQRRQQDRTGPTPTTSPGT